MGDRIYRVGPWCLSPTKGGKPVTWTPADRRLGRNRPQPPKPAKPKPSKP